MSGKLTFNWEGRFITWTCSHKKFMRTHLLVRGDEELSLLAEVDLEVVPRGLYVVDGIVYQYTGQPTFVIKRDYNFEGGPHVLHHVELIVEKFKT